MAGDAERPPGAACSSGLASDSSMPSMLPSASFRMMTRSRILIVPLSTSYLRAGMISPENLFPGKAIAMYSTGPMTRQYLQRRFVEPQSYPSCSPANHRIGVIRPGGAAPFRPRRSGRGRAPAAATGVPQKCDLRPEVRLQVGEGAEVMTGDSPAGLGTIARMASSFAPCNPHCVCSMRTISLVPSNCWLTMSERMTSSVTRPPALRMMWASPVRKPSASSTSRRASMHATIASPRERSGRQRGRSNASV